MRILLVDDHKIVRDGLRSCLAAESSWQVVGEAEDGEQAIRLARELTPSIVIMDIAMPGMNGIEATRHIINEDPSIKIIILSMHADREFVAEVLRAGASAYLLKLSAFDELVTAMHAVIGGKKYLSPPIADVVVENYVRRDGERRSSAFSLLTDRERQILQLLAEGHDAKSIAQRLNISPKTVHTFRPKIMEKLGLHSIAELTKYAIRCGLTPLSA